MGVPEFALESIPVRPAGYRNSCDYDSKKNDHKARSGRQ
jgi:hypothetical protein